MDTKSGAIRGKFVTFFGICSLQPSKRGLERLGEGLGRVLDGLGEGFGTVLEGFGRPGGARMETKILANHRYSSFLLFFFPLFFYVRFLNVFWRISE